MLKFYKDFHIQPVISGDSPTPTPTVKTGYIIVGGATDEDGIITVASGKYVTTNFNFNLSEYDSWAIVSKIYFMSAQYEDNGFMGLTNADNNIKSINSYVKNTGKVNYELSSGSNNTYDIGTLLMNSTGIKNTWFYVKCEFTGSAYNLYVGTSLDNMTLESTINKNTKVSNKSGVYVWGKGEGATTSVVVSSKFDMNETQIYLNGQLYWQGKKSGGGGGGGNPEMYAKAIDTYTITLSDEVIIGTEE